MDTGKLKRFATEARKVLLQGVTQRLTAVGFRLDGSCEEEPVLYGGGATFQGRVESVDFYNKWKSLQHAVVIKSAKDVVEEAAYTWFNRLMAAHILAKNGLVSPVLTYEAATIRVPLIVKEAQQGRLPQMDETSLEKVKTLLQDDSLTNDQFRELIVAFCHATPIINRCFGSVADYTELLLPQNILANGGFVDMINHTEFISDEDYRSPELIGWLYQFYISDKKDEVFAKKGKVEADEIPAATQIFTPNWIVKYMVQNTLGRIFLDNNPSAGDEFKPKWRYLVEPSEHASASSIYHYNDLTDLKVSDLACGSGHILNEFFDLLFDLYRYEGYSSKETINNIFKYNLTGIDIDTRAKQLAMFALLLKASQKDHSFADAHCLPHVYDMPEPYEDKYGLRSVLRNFIQGYDERVVTEIYNAIDLMDNADSLGSIMKFNISERTRNIIMARMKEYEQAEHVQDEIRKLFPYIRLILALTEKYAALVMNPPYMGGGNMNEVLGKYVKDNYSDGKADLCTAFMLLQGERVDTNGFYANIIPPSWMFLSSFENLRKRIIDNNVICSLLHLSRGVFGADFGSVSCVVQNRLDRNAKGTYFRLIERTFQEFDQKHLQLLFEKTLSNHDFRYLFANYNKDIEDVEYSESGARIYYPNIPQQNFKKIPGCPIGYWVSEKVLSCFDAPSLGDCVEIAQGLITSDNNRFLRFWSEVSKKNTCFTCESTEDTYGVKWYPYCKGGGFRKWYGLLEMVVDWEDDGAVLRNFFDENGKIKSRPQNIRFYFKEGITFNSITSTIPSLRYMKYCIFGGGGNGIFSNKDILPTLGFLNSNTANYLLDFLNPTLNMLVGDILSLPQKYHDCSLTMIVNGCINISRADWDAHETSLDFKTNEIVSLRQAIGDPIVTLSGDVVKGLRLWTLETYMNDYKSRWEKKFYQLHANEEELNRRFIEIYGLEDELTPDVPLKEVTILQQGEISIVEGKNGEELHWNDDVIVKQLISYAVGCMVGRYSIDKPGLILANQGDGIEKYNELVPDSRFEVDANGIIPLMSNNTEFTDNATMRFKTWLSVTFGEDKLSQNLNYIERCLGKTIDNYFVRDFWNDHKKMYQNRPIYWLFASKKKAFQCMVYMHRMDLYTVECIRSKYLLPHIEWLVNRQSELQSNAANLSTRERKELDGITQQVAECREFHDRLHVVADRQITIDLDDGVVVNHAKFGDVLAKIK